MNIRYYGIRHHGPGCAKSLKAALKMQQPDIILMEGPADAQDILAQAANKNLKPPVAMLLYNPKALQQASIFPFASFA